MLTMIDWGLCPWRILPPPVQVVFPPSSPTLLEFGRSSSRGDASEKAVEGDGQSAAELAPQQPIEKIVSIFQGK